MPLYMDIHTVSPDTTWEDIAKAHYEDVKIQDEYDVEYLKYWFNRGCNKLFCLVDAPNAEAARCVHQHAHGLVAEKLIEVDPDLVDGLLGSTGVNAAGAALVPGAKDDEQRDSGVRTIVFTDIANSTERTSLFGDRATIAMLAVHDGIVREALRKNGGREVKHTGDGIMAVFISAAHAVRFACQVQDSLRGHNEPAHRDQCRTPHRAWRRPVRLDGPARRPPLCPGRARTDTRVEHDPLIVRRAKHEIR